MPQNVKPFESRASTRKVPFGSLGRQRFELENLYLNMMPTRQALIDSPVSGELVLHLTPAKSLFFSLIPPSGSRLELTRHSILGDKVRLCMLSLKPQNGPVIKRRTARVA